MSSPRGGFTFVEMLLVLILGSVVMAGAFTVLIRQEKAYGSLTAAAAAQQDARTGIAVLSAELREISTVGGDLLMATRDSVRFRAMRKFGLVCQTDKNNRKLTVAQTGIDPFDSGDSIAVYVDGDSLLADDDIWQQEVVNNATTGVTCLTTLGGALSLLLPESDLVELSFTGNALRYDSIFPGAPIRSYEVLTYLHGTWDGDEMLLLRDADGDEFPVVGPIADPRGFILRYFDGSGTELTGFPLNATDRQNVRRIQIVLQAERQTSGSESQADLLLSDVHIRGN